MDNNYEEMVRSIRETTERIISEGPESCLRFLMDAGILIDEDHPPADKEEEPELVKALHGIPTAEDREWAARKAAEYAQRMLSQANAKIASLESELAVANQKIQDLQEWHDSHL